MVRRDSDNERSCTSSLFRALAVVSILSALLKVTSKGSCVSSHPFGWGLPPSPGLAPSTWFFEMIQLRIVCVTDKGEQLVAYSLEKTEPRSVPQKKEGRKEGDGAPRRETSVLVYCILAVKVCQETAAIHEGSVQVKDSSFVALHGCRCIGNCRSFVAKHVTNDSSLHRPCPWMLLTARSQMGQVERAKHQGDPAGTATAAQPLLLLHQGGRRLLCVMPESTQSSKQVASQLQERLLKAHYLGGKRPRHRRGLLNARCAG